METIVDLVGAWLGLGVFGGFLQAYHTYQAGLGKPLLELVLLVRSKMKLKSINLTAEKDPKLTLISFVASIPLGPLSIAAFVVARRAWRKKKQLTKIK